MGRKSESDEIADAYEKALALEKSGDIDAAVAAYATVLDMDPEDHGGVTVRLAALGRGATPLKAPEAYVEMLFDQHAESFEHILVDQLEYNVPILVRQRLDELAPANFMRMLDVGCGTGLTAEAMRDRADEIIGLDISERMIDICEAKDVYEGLYIGEIAEFFADGEEKPFDLVTACDVLPYLGSLETVFAGVASSLNDDGIFAFSTESLPGTDFFDAAYMVTPHHRFAHSETYLRKVLMAASFEVVEVTDISVRLQDNAPTPGQLIIARKIGAH